MIAYKAKSLFANRRLLGLIALCLITFFFNLGKAPVYILDEAKNAQCAREMLQRHDWIVPTFNQKLRTDKPPLHYFFMGLAYSIMGVNEFSARFFSACCGLITVLLTYRFASRHFNKQTGFLSALLLLASWHFTLEMRMAVPDPYLILLFTLTLYNLYGFCNSSYNKTKNLIGFYVFIGLGLLCKGPVALIIPVIVVIVHLAASGHFNINIIKKFRPISGLAIVSVLSVPWYYLAHVKTNGAYTESFFIVHNVNRFLGAKENHGGVFIITPLMVLVGMLPFSLLAFSAARQFYKKDVNNKVERFLWVAITVIILFFSFSRTKLPNYPMPCYPLLSIVLASSLQSIIAANKSIKIYLYFLIIVSAVIPLALYQITVKEPVLQHVKGLWVPFLILPAGLLAAILVQYSKSNYKTQTTVYITLTMFIISGWLLNSYAYTKVYGANPVAASLREKFINEPVLAYKTYNAAYNFYLKQPIKRFENADSLKQYLQSHRQARVIVREKHLHELDSLNLKSYYRGKDIFESHVNHVLKAK